MLVNSLAPLPSTTVASLPFFSEIGPKYSQRIPAVIVRLGLTFQSSWKKSPIRLLRRSLRRAEGTPVVGSNWPFSETAASLRKSQTLLKLYPGRSDQKGASTE